MRLMTIQFVSFHTTISIISCGKTWHIANPSLHFCETEILYLFFVAWGVTSLLVFLCVYSAIFERIM